MRLALGARPLVERRLLHPVLDTFMRSLPRAYEAVEAMSERGLMFWSEARLEDAGHCGARPIGAPRDGRRARGRRLRRMSQDVAWKLLSRTIAVPDAVPELRSRATSASDGRLPKRSPS